MKETSTMKADVKERSTQKSKMRADRAKMYAYLLSKLSKESLDELKRHEGFEEAERTVCPLSVWKLVKAIHLICDADYSISNIYFSFVKKVNHTFFNPTK